MRKAVFGRPRDLRLSGSVPSRSESTPYFTSSGSDGGVRRVPVSGGHYAGRRDGDGQRPRDRGSMLSRRTGESTAVRGPARGRGGDRLQRQWHQRGDRKSVV